MNGFSSQLLTMGGVWRPAALAKLLPRSLREGLYLLIARNRYQLLGKRDTCRLPTPEERSLFLPIRIKLKSAWADGTHSLLFTPSEFLERLVALIPAPKFHTTR